MAADKHIIFWIKIQKSRKKICSFYNCQGFFSLLFASLFLILSFHHSFRFIPFHFLSLLLQMRSVLRSFDCDWLFCSAFFSRSFVKYFFPSVTLNKYLYYYMSIYRYIWTVHHGINHVNNNNIIIWTLYTMCQGTFVHHNSLYINFCAGSIRSSYINNDNNRLYIQMYICLYIYNLTDWLLYALFSTMYVCIYVNKKWIELKLEKRELCMEV